jgi:hypothetical protein
MHRNTCFGFGPLAWKVREVIENPLFTLRMKGSFVLYCDPNYTNKTIASAKIKLNIIL